MNMQGETVVITGGTGTFGRALTRHLLSMPNGPAAIRILSRDEVKQAEMRSEFEGQVRLRYLLGDVRDYPRLQEAFDGASVVFHAAAMKRIEACAYDPQEAILTNVLGSMNVARAAAERRVRRVVALSTDKACAPSTVYGATKMCAEAVFTSSTARAEAWKSGDRRPVMSAVRYGNVMGSRGSVLQVWREAIRRGDPIPVVNPTYTRFWYTVKEAVELALFANLMSTGGELVVPSLNAFTIASLAASFLRVHEIPESRFYRIEARHGGEKEHEYLVSQDEAPSFQVVDSPIGRLFIRSHRPPNDSMRVLYSKGVCSLNSAILAPETLDAYLREFL